MHVYICQKIKYGPVSTFVTIGPLGQMQTLRARKFHSEEALQSIEACGAIWGVAWIGRSRFIFTYDTSYGYVNVQKKFEIC
jgi:hypothetical protein